MRILHVIPSISPVHGGPSRAIAMIESALATAGVAVTTLTTDDDGPGRRLTEAARPTQINGVARIYKRKRLDFYKVAPGIVPWLWRNVGRFDAVHVHALFSFTSIAACFVARLRRVPYVVRPLGTLSAYGMTRRRPWLKRLSLGFVDGPAVRHAAAVHFTSTSELDEAEGLGLVFRGAVVPLGVEPVAGGDRQFLADEHPAIGDRQAILFLSRLDPKKNIETLLHAFAHLKRRQITAVLLIAGDGPSDYVARLTTLAVSLGIENEVVWLGHVEGGRKSAALACADVFVLPSFSENFGIAAVEAMLAGLPCVLGMGVATARDMEKAGGGLTVPPEPAAVADAIERILGDAALRRHMGMCAKEFAEREFSMRGMAAQLVALYEKVCSASRRRVA